MGKQPVDAGHAHVVQPHHLAAQHLGGERRLLGHGDVAGAAGGDDDFSDAVGLGKSPHNAHPCVLMVVQFPCAADIGRRFGGHSGDEDAVLTVGAHGVDDAADLLRGLPRAVDHLCRALPHLPVQIDLRVADVLEGGLFQFQHGVVHAGFPGLDGFQKLSDFRVHLRTSRFSRTLS